MFEGVKTRRRTVGNFDLKFWEIIYRSGNVRGAVILCFAGVCFTFFLFSCPMSFFLCPVNLEIYRSRKLEKTHYSRRFCFNKVSQSRNFECSYNFSISAKVQFLVGAVLEFMQKKRNIYNDLWVTFIWRPFSTYCLTKVTKYSISASY